MYMYVQVALIKNVSIFPHVYQSPSLHIAWNCKAVTTLCTLSIHRHAGISGMSAAYSSNL